MVSFCRYGAVLAAALVSLVFVTGCDHGGGGGGGSQDVGDNNPGLVICVGDSITGGYMCDGAPYPSVLSSLTGKTCVNLGVNGALASEGASKIKSQLARKPGYVCIMYGANDAIFGHDVDKVGAGIRAIISACKANKSVPIVATTPQMIGRHAIYNGAAERINGVIRQVAGEEGVTCVNVNGALGSDEANFSSDGLHPNATGARKIAECFAGAL